MKDQKGRAAAEANALLFQSRHLPKASKAFLGRAEMKTIGIIGGIAPESTIEYYRLIIASYRKQKQDGSYPSILINSIDMKKLLDLIA